MKKLAILLIPFLLIPTESLAGYRDEGSARGRTCYKEVWREEYIPGDRNNRGYVKRWQETKRIPCRNQGQTQHYQEPDTNSCIEGAILGGILGGGAGAAASRRDGRLWAIPLGIVGGSLVGCQIDGG